MYRKVGEYRGDLDLLQRALTPLLSWSPNGSATKHFHDGDMRELIVEELSPLIPGDFEMVMMTAVRGLGGTLPYHADTFNTKKLQRHHLIVQSNSLSWVLHNGDWQQLEVGGIYQMNPTYTHASVNWGESPRVHIVVDTTKES